MKGRSFCKVQKLFWSCNFVTCIKLLQLDTMGSLLDQMIKKWLSFHVYLALGMV